ncbi:MAG: ArsB/NhaD family transporter, partial [Eubacteriales bacterium]
MSSTAQLILVTGIFISTYALIMSEKIHRSIVALAGALLMLLLGLISFEEAKTALELNTIGLLIGMMIIVGITRRTGVFQYLAIKAAQWAKWQPMKILVALSVITAVLSALLDNVTTVLLIVPVTFSIVDTLGLNPVPFLVSEILASNIGGTATLIGDPPNIMIGSAVPELGFMDFVINLSPIVILIFIVITGILYLLYRSELSYNPALAAKLKSINPEDEIKDYVLMKKSLFVLGLTMLGFILHQVLHWDSSVIAMAGAVLL